MIVVPTSELSEGMFLARDIRAHDNRLLLARGSQLTNNFLRLLQHRRVPAVYVEQEGTEDICAEDVIPTETRMQCQMAIQHAMGSFQRQAEARHISLNTRTIQDATFGMVEEILSNRSVMVAMMDMRDWGGRFFQHSVNTAVLATILAKKMGYKEDECKHLAMGMIFHDCGQMFLPREIFEKQGRLSEEEFKVARQHVRVGFKQTLNNDILSPLSAHIILRHHERMDGTGYPDRLTADQIHPLARIASVVEAFDAMTSLRPYNRAMMPDRALRKILRGAGTEFDRDVALTLTRFIAIYPTGSAVRLNTGERGIVVSTPTGNTTRPTVRLFFGPDGRRMSLTDVDLTKDSSRLVAMSGVSMDQVKDPMQQ